MHPIKCSNNPLYEPTLDELCCGQVAINTATGCFYVKRCDENGLQKIIKNCPEEEIVRGCTDVNAKNYNPDATVDDGSCEYVDDAPDLIEQDSSQPQCIPQKASDLCEPNIFQPSEEEPDYPGQCPIQPIPGQVLSKSGHHYDIMLVGNWSGIPGTDFRECGLPPDYIKWQGVVPGFGAYLKAKCTESDISSVDGDTSGRFSLNNPARDNTLPAIPNYQTVIEDDLGNRPEVVTGTSLNTMIEWPTGSGDTYYYKQLVKIMYHVKEINENESVPVGSFVTIEFLDCVPSDAYFQFNTPETGGGGGACPEAECPEVGDELEIGTPDYPAEYERNITDPASCDEGVTWEVKRKDKVIDDIKYFVTVKQGFNSCGNLVTLEEVFTPRTQADGDSIIGWVASDTLGPIDGYEVDDCARINFYLSGDASVIYPNYPEYQSSQANLKPLGLIKAANKTGAFLCYLRMVEVHRLPSGGFEVVKILSEKVTVGAYDEGNGTGANTYIQAPELGNGSVGPSFYFPTCT